LANIQSAAYHHFIDFTNDNIFIFTVDWSFFIPCGMSCPLFLSGPAARRLRVGEATPGAGKEAERRYKQQHPGTMHLSGL
jgi:hypothetical protein